MKSVSSRPLLNSARQERVFQNNLRVSQRRATRERKRDDSAFAFVSICSRCQTIHDSLQVINLNHELIDEVIADHAVNSKRARWGRATDTINWSSLLRRNA
jgi:hypothetical protein